MKRQNEVPVVRRLGASPDVVIGSVHAVTEQEHVLIASDNGSQLASSVYRALTVIRLPGNSTGEREMRA